MEENQGIQLAEYDNDNKQLSLLGILFEMRFLNLSINSIVDFCPHLGSFCCFSHYVSAKFHLWPSSGD